MVLLARGTILPPLEWTKKLESKKSGICGKEKELVLVGSQAGGLANLDRAPDGVIGGAGLPGALPSSQEARLGEGKPWTKARWIDKVGRWERHSAGSAPQCPLKRSGGGGGKARRRGGGEGGTRS